MVPWTMVPAHAVRRVSNTTEGKKLTILELDGDGLILALHQKPSIGVSCLILFSLRIAGGPRRANSPDELHDGRAMSMGNARLL